MLKPNKPMHYAGWISPEGDLYSCPRECHRDLAKLILFEIYKIEYEYQEDHIRNPERFIEDEGWLKVTAEGRAWHHLDDDITQAQLNKLDELLTCKHHTQPPMVIKNWEGQGDRYIHGTEQGWIENIKNSIGAFTCVIDQTIV